MLEEIEYQKYREKSDGRNLSIELPIDIFKSFYSQNPVGVSMSTYKELTDILVAARKAAEIYAKMNEDGKLTWDDLKNEAGELIELGALVKEAATIDGPIVIKELTEEQAKELLTSALGTIFTVVKLTPSGTQTATYTELKEIFDAFSSGANIFYSAAKDGKFTVTDVLVNIGDIVDFSNLIKKAVQINGQINIGDLSNVQIQELIGIFYSDCSTIVKAIKALSPAPANG